MPTLISVLGLVRDALGHIESGRVSDAAAYLEMIEEDLQRVIVAAEPGEVAH